jgi:hypothetical protein
MGSTLNPSFRLVQREFATRRGGITYRVWAAIAAGATGRDIFIVATNGRRFRVSKFK